MIPENGITLDTILEGILTEGDEVEEAVRTMRSDLLRAAMPILAMPSNLNVKAEQPDSCSDSMVCPKYILLPKSCFLLTLRSLHFVLVSGVKYGAGLGGMVFSKS